MKPAPLDVVCAVIARSDGRFLAARVPPHKRLGGLWEFPGGKIEAGESPETALRREIREELGVGIDPGRPLAVVDHDYGDFRIRLHPILARLADGEPTAAEHPELIWVNLDEAAALEWAPADQPVLAKLGQGQA